MLSRSFCPLDDWMDQRVPFAEAARRLGVFFCYLRAEGRQCLLFFRGGEVLDMHTHMDGRQGERLPTLSVVRFHSGYQTNPFPLSMS